MKNLYNNYVAGWLSVKMIYRSTLGLLKVGLIELLSPLSGGGVDNGVI